MRAEVGSSYLVLIDKDLYAEYPDYKLQEYYMVYIDDSKAMSTSRHSDKICRSRGRGEWQQVRNGQWLQLS